MTEIICDSFDDLLRKSLTLIRTEGRSIRPSKGPATEVIGASLKLTNPLARFSRTESRGILYSALGETLWYLSGSDSFDVIEHYIPSYRDRCETPKDVVQSEAAYGPRLKEQMPFIIEAVKRNDTRKAVISIYRQADHKNTYDVPCTCTLQFFPRSGVLHTVAQMRSNDVFTGMAHDIFAFTILQEFLARSAGLQLGTYIHQVGSFHLYESDFNKAERYELSGFTDNVPMPPMPERPEEGLNWLIQAEAALRLGTECPDPSALDAYWLDLARILGSLRARKMGDRAGLISIRDAMSSRAFRTFLQDEIERL